MRVDPTGIGEQPEDTSSEAFFEGRYRENRDPWNFACSEYELRRYDATLAALEGRLFEHGFEPGCSVGVLTERLAAICAQVDAMDISASAVESARQRCAGLANVRVTCGSVTEMPAPEFEFDLVVISEIGYYLTEEQLVRCAAGLVDRMTVGGVLLAVHWLGQSADHRLSGDRVHELLGGIAGLVRERTERHEGFRLDRWRREH